MFSIMSDSEEQDVNNSDDDEDLINLLFAPSSCIERLLAS
jgi:hypothetical protein